MSHNLFAGVESYLSVGGCWLTMEVVAEDWGDFGHFFS